MENNKIIVSIQIPKDIYDKLKEQAYEECTTISYLIRRAIIKDVNGGKK